MLLVLLLVTVVTINPSVSAASLSITPSTPSSSVFIIPSSFTVSVSVFNEIDEPTINVI